VVSTGWKEDFLGNIATLQRGFDLPHRLRKPGAVPIVTSSGMEDKHCDAKVRAPGVVTGRYGTIGNVFFVRDDFWPLNTTLYVRDFHGNDPLFISYLLRTIDFRTHSGKSGVPGVNRNDLHEIKVSLPADRIQQKVVAEALSDADALVESLEQLLTKKRGVKQAAMQVLLTGKKRLKGFGANVSYRQTEAGMIPDDWEVRQLGEVTTFLDGKRRPVKDGDRAKMRGSIPYYGASGIVDYVNNYLFDEDLILLGEDGENIISRNTRLAFRISGKTWVNNHAHVLRPKPTVCIGFLTDYLESLNFERFNSGTAQPKLNKQTCYAIPLALPSSHAEQEAVALILSDVDREIAATEARLGKARAVKQGMMQELLTGRTHLV
jgi:type I restriction enzyme, S subunit